MPTTDTPTADSVSPATAPPSTPPSTPRGRGGRLGTASFRLLVLGFLGFNTWWFVRDIRPLPAMREVIIWVNTGQHAKAEPILREHLRRTPHDADARMLLARSLAAREDLDACARELEQVPFWSPRKQEALFLEGNVNMLMHRARRAEAAWLACIADDPLHPCPWDYFKASVEALIELYALELRWEQAHNVVWRMYDEVDSDDHENVIIMRLRMEIERISVDSALAQLRRYLEADPQDLQARCALATYEQTEGNTPEALKLVKQGLAEHPENVDLWRTYLQVLRDSGDMTTLAEEVVNLPAEADSDGTIWGIRGLVLETAGDFEKAVEAFRKAVELQPAEAETHYRYGLALGRAGRREEGRAAIELSRKMQEARSTLLDSIQDFNAATRPGVIRGENFNQTTRELAEKCRVLGMPRVAEGLLSLLPAPPSQMAQEPVATGM